MEPIMALGIYKNRGKGMRLFLKFATFTLTAALTMLLSAPAKAHLMVAQHGTLNFVDEGAFMVLSLPVSAFDNLDDNHDGSVSMIEFNRHRGDIINSIGQHVTLSDDEGQLHLGGIMLSPVAGHGSADGSLSQLTVMGRFSLDGTRNALRFQFQLFGKEPAEQLLKLTVTRESDGQEQVLKLTPAVPADLLFAQAHR